MTRIISVAAFVLAVAAVSAGGASASGKSGFIRTPDGKIYCGWGTGPQGFVVCGIWKGFLKPKPKNNCRKQGVDYVGNRIAFNVTGKAKVQACAGDAGPFANRKAAKVIRYGGTWHAGGMSCISQAKAMQCKNKSGHGFLISAVQKYRLF
ncbi:MAG TPA: DUF6636 domain-containing protein [Gaiellaceae bacterium]